VSGRLDDQIGASAITGGGALPRFCIVTACKGRLEYLSQALPTFVVQNETEVVVVDYDCPDRTKDWVAAHFPAVRVVALSDAPVFNLSRARNAGARAARAPWLVFCDADQLLAPSFAEELGKRLAPGAYLRTLRSMRSGELRQGVPLACEASVFWGIGGYDDAFSGWGPEDREFINRLDRAGIREVLGEATLVETLRHSNATRSSFYEHAIDVSMVINHHYARIKQRYFETRGAWLTDAQRHSTFRQVEQAVLAALASSPSDATFDIRIDAADPPWTARLTASAVRDYHRLRVEALAQITL
jgi:glycosyltransferase involved in cell wall biosynthesis